MGVVAIVRPNLQDFCALCAKSCILRIKLITHAKNNKNIDRSVLHATTGF